MNKKAFLTTLPNFVEIQRASFCWFLTNGLNEEFEKISSIKDLYGASELNFFGQEYKIQKPKYNIIESKYRDSSYSVRIYIPVSLKINENKNLYRENLKIYIFIVELPLITDRGTFIINGCERVVINQIIRAPGVYYKKEEILKNSEPIYSATLIPNRGSWLKFEIDKKKQLYVSIDKSEKISIFEFFDVFETELNIFSNLSHPKFLEVLRKVHKAFQKIKQEIQGKKLYESNKAENIRFFNEKIFTPKQYELGKLGRYALNKRFNLNIPKNTSDLTFQDIIAIINELINLKYDEVKVDDIDHLKNRRVRSIGELLQTQFRSGLTSLERILSERLTLCDSSIINLKKFVNPKPMLTVMREFFGSSQLSQFLDQTNPLSELTHRRRISGLGPGGFSRDHVSFAVRDIHPSHHGRICPIETPEGQNAGLISSMSIYARINSFGFIETPFFKVKNGQILNNESPIYLTSEEEEEFKIAPADIAINSIGQILEKNLTVRYKQDFLTVPLLKVQLIDVSPIQIISSAASLIPFLEHNDANRSLMGANMQRQAVPLLYPHKAIIGSGFEVQLATDAGTVLINYRDGWVNYVSSDKIKIKNKVGKEIIYHLQKYLRSNQDTCINQRPIVWIGESVKCGQIIADGPSTEGGEMALGQNILIAYMPWEGYNYEDALLINERLIYTDLFTSIHIEKYDLEILETKSGTEELTRDLPNINEKTTKNLDENGIIYKGKFVNSGDILVGKVTPKEEIDEIPEGRLLRAIFGEKGHSVIDNSLRVPNGSYGRILDIKIFSRENGDDLPACTNSVVRIFLAQIRKIQVGDKMSGRHGNKGIISKILSRQDMPYLPNGQIIDLILNPLGVPSRMNVGQLFEGLFGFAADLLDKRFKILPFDEMYENDASRILINNSLIKAKKKNKNNWIYCKNSPGKISLRDGRTGEIFENPITVCKSYFFKLIHLVDDKIHARSTGPYSLVTQQPLGGRSQQGGQRFGEMEVWALEAFGAGYTLQELLTIKSDDINGRNSILNSIVKGEALPNPDVPESFKVLILELQALSININTYKIKRDKKNEIHDFALNILEEIKPKTNIPNYQSIEIN
jgi:DNA-directed RNA polymerase subunit beta